MVACGYLAIGLIIGIVWTALATDRWDVWFEGGHPVLQIIGITVTWGVVFFVVFPLTWILDKIADDN